MSEVFTLISSPVRMATAAMPRITRATRISTSDSPRSSAQPDWMRCTSDLDLVKDAVHGGDQGDGDEADGEDHEDDDDRLDERGELVDLVVQLGLVVLGGDRE